MAKIIRLDIINGNPRTFVAPQDLEQGFFLEMIGKAENVHLGADPDYEAYKVQLASADTERGQLMLHASVPNQYDVRLMEADFVLKEGKVGRGYQPIMGDIVTIAMDLVEGGTAEVGNKLALGANGMLAVNETNAIAVVEAVEDIVIPMYKGQWEYKDEVDDMVQKSVVIRFL